MKRLFTILLLAILVAGTAYSQKATLELFKKAAPIEMQTPTLKTDMFPFEGKSSIGDKIQGLTVLDQTTDALYNNYLNVTPFIYEPISNTLMLVFHVRNFQTNPITGELNILYSTNDGANWVKRQIFSKSGSITVWPSISAINPDAVTNPNELKLLVYSVLAQYDNIKDYPWSGAQYVIVDGTNSPDGYPIVSPRNNSAQKWWTCTTTSSSSNYFYQAGMTSVVDQNNWQQRGCYGVGMFEYSPHYDLLVSQVPPQWGFDRFKAPEQTGYYNGPINIDADKDGNVYAIVNNISSSATDRTPAVSKSVDHGYTWSEFIPMPQTIIDAYIISQGGAILADHSPFPWNTIAYQTNGFVVTGVDEYSFLIRIIVWIDDNTFSLHIVEAYFKDGVWGIRKVANFKLSNFEPFFPFVIENVAPTGSTTMLDTLLTSNLGNELQISKTADGEYLIAKYIDFRDDYYHFPTPYSIYNGQITFDSIPTTDVFCSYRKKTETEWSPAVNVTNTVFYDKFSYIPPIVPSITKVPLITFQTFKATNTAYPRYPYPDMLQQLCVDQTQNIAFTMVDLTVNAVNEPPKFNFSLRDAYPNPSTDKAEIGFNLDKSAQVRLEVFSPLGQKIATLVNSWQSDGIHAVNFDTHSLANGVYYYTITVDGTTATKMMVVAH